MNRAKLSIVEIGEKLQMKNVDHTIEYEVLPPCEEKHGGRWYCATHDVGFRNQFEKDIHIDRGRHKLAWCCFTHGMERP